MGDIPSQSDYATTDECFRLVWAGLAHLGWCDAPGGTEYKRVYEEWIEAGRPSPVTWFIMIRANVPAGDRPAPVARESEVTDA